VDRHEFIDFETMIVLINMLLSFEPAQLISDEGLSYIMGMLRSLKDQVWPDLLMVEFVDAVRPLVIKLWLTRFQNFAVRILYYASFITPKHHDKNRRREKTRIRIAETFEIENFLCRPLKQPEDREHTLGTGDVLGLLADIGQTTEGFTNTTNFNTGIGPERKPFPWSFSKILDTLKVYVGKWQTEHRDWACNSMATVILMLDHIHKQEPKQDVRSYSPRDLERVCTEMYQICCDCLQDDDAEIANDLHGNANRLKKLLEMYRHRG